MKVLKLGAIALVLLFAASQSHAYFVGCGFFPQSGATLGYCKSELQNSNDYTTWSWVTSEYVERAGETYAYQGAEKQSDNDYAYNDYVLPRVGWYQLHRVRGKHCFKKKRDNLYECYVSYNSTTW